MVNLNSINRLAGTASLVWLTCKRLEVSELNQLFEGIAPSISANIDPSVLSAPEIDYKELRERLEAEFGLKIQAIVFLPLGADQDTAVYRVDSTDNQSYFLKLRRGSVSKAAVELPFFLSQQGCKQVIPPIRSTRGQLWTTLDPYKAILYSYIEGRNAFEGGMSPEQWLEFGRILKVIHTTKYPATLTAVIGRDVFLPVWRQQLMSLLQVIEAKSFKDSVARNLADFLVETRRDLVRLVNRSQALAAELQTRSREFILCHGDIHGWNLLIDSGGGLHVVDWDTLVFAPKERDLMFIGGGLGESGYSPEEEETFFYQGYGEIEIDLVPLAYYRYERVIEDIAIICNQVFRSEVSDSDRLQALGLVSSNFLPGSTIDIANNTYNQLKNR